MAPPARLDLNLLAVAVALQDEGGVSRAALKLGLSQPAVSGALARLRRHFDDPLFVRVAAGMAPTPRGASLVERARELLRQVDEELLAPARFNPTTEQRPFTFAMSDVGEMVFLPRLLERLGREAPGAMLRSVSLRPLALAEALEAGEVDLAIGYFPDLKRRSGLFQQRLMQHRFTGLLRHDHPLQGARLSQAEFLGLQHVVVQSEGRSQEIFERFLKARGLSRRVALTTPHFLAVPRLVAGSDLAAVVPHALARVHGVAAHGLRTVRLPFDTPPIELNQHWHRKVHKDARHAWLRALVSALFNPANDEW